MSRIFLSYSREDQPTARRFAEALQRAGFGVWWDQALAPGEAFDEATERALEGASAVVVLWSRHSVASRWVRAEATQALANRTLVPVMIEPCKRPIMFELSHSVDLAHWQGDESDFAWQALVASVRAMPGKQGVAPAVPVPSAPALPTAIDRGRIRSRLWIAAAALLALAIGAGAYWLHGRGWGASPSAKTQTNVAKQTEQLTLAVLPFDNLSSDPEQEYFADGMTEELLNSLARVSGLQVTGRTSAFYFKGKNEDLKLIGEKLGVDHLLEGSVRKDGDQLRITAQLIKARDGFHLWSQTYDRPMKDVFKVQEEIARAVAEALQISLGVGELGHMPGMTRDVKAYEAYVEGRSLQAANVNRAITQLERAVEIDPQFVLAWQVLAGTYRATSNFGSLESGQELVRKANEALENAIRASPDPRIKKLMQGGIQFQRGEWVRMESGQQETDALLAGLNLPSRWQEVQGIDLYRIAEDKARQAIAGLEKVRSREPLQQRVAVNLAEAYANAGRLEDALAENRRGLSIGPSSQLSLAAVYTAKATGDATQMEDAWKRWEAASPRDSSLTRRLAALRAQPEQARAEIRRFLDGPASGEEVQLALFAAYFDDDQLALKFLQKGVPPDRRFAVAYSLWRPVMAGVRKLPGFKDVVRDLGLVEYWKEFGWGEHCQPVGADDFECH